MYPTVVPNHPCVLRCNSKWFEPCLTIIEYPLSHQITRQPIAFALARAVLVKRSPISRRHPFHQHSAAAHPPICKPILHKRTVLTEQREHPTQEHPKQHAVFLLPDHTGKFARHIEPTSPHPWVFTPTMYYSFFFRKEIIGIVGLLIGLITHWTFVWRRWSSTAFTMLSRLIDAYGVVIIRRLMGSFTIWPALIINQIQGNWWAKVMCTSPPFVCASWAEFVPQNVWFLASLEQAYKRTTLPNFLSIGFPTAKGANSHFYVDDTT